VRPGKEGQDCMSCCADDDDDDDDDDYDDDDFVCSFIWFRKLVSSYQGNNMG
jgi:hypothetical protein